MLAINLTSPVTYLEPCKSGCIYKEPTAFFLGILLVFGFIEVPVIVPINIDAVSKSVGVTLELPQLEP